MAAPIPPAVEYLRSKLLQLEPRSKDGGIYANKPGYHNTRSANSPNNYSVVDAPDKGGPSNMAAAFDWTFPDAQAADYDTIIKYSKRLLDSGKDPNDDRLNWMREFYGQADQDTQVEGWDFRYAQPATSDPSHLWHIHFSFSRNALTNANMDKLLDVLTGGDMALTDADCEKLADYLARDSEFLDGIVNAIYHRDGTPAIANKYYPWRTDSPAHEPPGTNEWITGGTAHVEAAQRANEAYEATQEILAKLDEAGDGTVIIGPELLKQVMLDPVVTETYAKAIAEKIVGINFEIVE